MHPGRGPWREAWDLYVTASALEARLKEAPSQELCVFDVGLGAAANALAALACHARALESGSAVSPLRLVSFEQDPEPAYLAIEESHKLGYPQGWEEVLEVLLAESRVSLPGGCSWELRLGDFTQLITEEPARANVIFHDPFSATSNPAMWSAGVFSSLYACRRRAVASTLVTYSTAFSVRAGLLLAGFYVGEAPHTGRRSTGTLASTNLSDLQEPLDARWLQRWRRDKQPWPPLTGENDRASLRKSLLEHPQWAGIAEQVPREPTDQRAGRPSGKGSGPTKTGYARKPRRR